MDNKAENSDKESMSLPKWTIIFIICTIGSCILGFIISTFFYQHTRVHGISMEYTLRENDVIIINKHIYKSNDPERFDIVLFNAKNDEYYIKRIIGLPNEKIQINDGKIYINDEPLDESYGLDPIADAGIADCQLTIGDDEYFVLGDNRNYSTDSRDEDIGMISFDSIIGKAVYHLFPFTRLGKINDEANFKLNSSY